MPAPPAPAMRAQAPRAASLTEGVMELTVGRRACVNVKGFQSVSKGRLPAGSQHPPGLGPGRRSRLWSMTTKPAALILMSVAALAGGGAGAIVATTRDA